MKISQAVLNEDGQTEKQKQKEHFCNFSEISCQKHSAGSRNPVVHQVTLKNELSKLTDLFPLLACLCNSQLANKCTAQCS